MPPVINEFLPYLNIVLTIALVVGGVLGFRRGYSKEIHETQERVINALKEEVDTLNSKILDLEKDRDRQNSVLSTIRYVLKQRGLKITIDGEVVTLSESGKNSKVVRIQPRTNEDDEDSDVV